MSKNYSLIVLMLASVASAAAPATRPAASLRPMSRPAPDYRTLYNKSQTELAQARAKITMLEEQMQTQADYIRELSRKLDQAQRTAATRPARPASVMVVTGRPQPPNPRRFEHWPTDRLERARRAMQANDMGTEDVDEELAYRRARDAIVNQLDP